MDIETISRKNLRALVGAYRRSTGRTLAAVSKELYGNGTFLGGFFAKKQGLTLSKFDQMVDAIRGNWPEEAEWPHLDSIIFEPPAKKRGR